MAKFMSNNGFRVLVALLAFTSLSISIMRNEKKIGNLKDKLANLRNLEWRVNNLESRLDELRMHVTE